MCCVTPGALYPQPHCFFRLYLGRIHFQECVIPVPYPDEGMLNDLVKPEPPCFHTGAEGPGIDGALPGARQIPETASKPPPIAIAPASDSYDQSVSSGHKPKPTAWAKCAAQPAPAGGNLRESCYYENRNSRLRVPKTFDGLPTPPNENWNDEHQVGRQPVVVRRIGSPSTNETVSSTFLHAEQNPPGQSLTKTRLPKTTAHKISRESSMRL